MQFRLTFKTSQVLIVLSDASEVFIKISFFILLPKTRHILYGLNHN